MLINNMLKAAEMMEKLEREKQQIRVKVGQDQRKDQIGERRGFFQKNLGRRK